MGSMDCLCFNLRWNLSNNISYSIFKPVCNNQVNSLHQLLSNFTCDLCRIQLLSWDIMYRCEEKACDAHNICKYCSFNMILTNTQINNLLISILKHKLNSDCVKVIYSKKFVFRSEISPTRKFGEVDTRSPDERTSQRR